MPGPQRGEETNSTIGSNSRFEGRFAVKGSIRIDGKFEGEVLIVDKVFIGPNGKVKTNIKASSVVVEGILIGNIQATSRVLLLPTSRILGDIQTPELIIQNGTILKGRCTISHSSDQDARELILSLYEKDSG
ncbi:MAG: cell division protein [Spirochaetes bacterium DG_61]|jgi:cytoskeletal protein CcmA (bactofilin family)|nr:MAG: cell division protein [Spirochaetes bacterium DG_61]